jgi:hypothetical protein
MGIVSKVLRATEKATTKAAPRVESRIADWQWRPMDQVRADIPGLTRVEPHITDVYGSFMSEQAGKAKQGKLGNRDAVKAYGITRSSVNRTARKVDDDIAKGEARPEGYMAEWLLSPQGQRYLDSVERGVPNEEAIADIVQRFKPFGMADTLGEDLHWAAGNAHRLGLNGRLGELVQGDPSTWRSYAQGLRGIGPAKSGFYASLLGRGDLPTLDARQLQLHTGAGGADASKYMRRGGGLGGDEAVDRLASRQSELALDLPPSLEPFRQHLTHHGVWDEVGGTRTTHADLVGAMQRGRASIPAMAGLAVAGAGGAGGLKAYRDIKSAQEERKRQLRLQEQTDPQ